MQPGWILGLWAAALAAIVGVLVAAATSSSAPPWWLLAVLVVLPCAVTVGARFRGPLRRHLHRLTAAASPASEEEVAAQREARRRARSGSTASATGAEERTSPRPLAADDWDVVSEISCALGPHQLGWLRSNDFVTPWLDRHARAVVEVEPLLRRVVERPFAPELRGALTALAEAVHAFAEDYAHNTFPDPVLPGEEWRFFEWDDRVLAGEDGNGGDRWAGRAKHLQQLAEGVALAYGDFRAVALRNPNVRQRIPSRA